MDPPMPFPALLTLGPHGLSNHHQVEISTHEVKSMISYSLLKAHKVCFWKHLLNISHDPGRRQNPNQLIQETNGFYFQRCWDIEGTKKWCENCCFLGTGGTGSVFRSPVRMGAEKKAVLGGLAPPESVAGEMMLASFFLHFQFPGRTFH